MFYTTYVITNKINGKKYIGVHKTNNLDDGYMGSGKLIRRAIQKYGIKNFTKEISGIWNSEKEAYNAESNMVNNEIVENDMYYNQTIGGRGGSIKGLNVGIKKTTEHRKNISKSLTGLRKTDNHRQKLSLAKIGKVLSTEHSKNISIGQKLNGKNGKYVRTDEIKQKQRDVRKSQKWINNGIERKMVDKNDLDLFFKSGWKLGKKI